MRYEMNIAVSYNEENGFVFPHFGHAPAFKFYEVQDGQVASSEVVQAEGSGHGYMVGLMEDRKIEVVICGRIGAHALEGLKEVGIEVYIVPEVPTDVAVEAYLSGALAGKEASDAGCADGSSCGNGEGCGGGCGDEDGGCGCGCGGGCGGCHQEMEVIYEGKNAGKIISVHYRGTLNDGTQFDSSFDRGEPLTFTCGVGQMIKGFDMAVLNMEVGEEVNIHLLPEDAYGEINPNAVLHFEIAQLPGSKELELGQRVVLRNQMGQPIPVTVTEKDDVNITLDANHELAGKELNFHIEVVEIQE